MFISSYNNKDNRIKRRRNSQHQNATGSQQIVLSHPIDPLIDYPFKLIFGRQENEEIILSFLNAVIQPKNEITQVTIQNPFNDREFENDKLSIVEVRVQDKSGAIYHIEVQLITNNALKSRVLYYWAKLYAEQLKSGEDYSKLKPVHSIWITRAPLTNEPSFHNKVNFRYEASNRLFLDHCQIHLLELNKFKLSQLGGNFKLPRDILKAWLLFLKDGNSWRQLPEPLSKSKIMRSTMEILEQVSEQENNYFHYLGRFQYKAEQLTLENQRKEAFAQRDKLAKEVELKDKKLLAQAERIKALEAQLNQNND